MQAEIEFATPSDYVAINLTHLLTYLLQLHFHVLNCIVRNGQWQRHCEVGRGFVFNWRYVYKPI